MTAVVRARWTPRQLMGAAVSTGRPTRRTAGGWLDDLAQLGKAILLCGTCSRKFSPGSVGYEEKQAVPGYRFVWSTCDGCKNSNAQCTLYMRGTK